MAVAPPGEWSAIAIRVWGDQPSARSGPMCADQLAEHEAGIGYPACCHLLPEPHAPPRCLAGEAGGDPPVGKGRVEAFAGGSIPAATWPWLARATARAVTALRGLVKPSESTIGGSARWCPASAAPAASLAALLRTVLSASGGRRRCLCL